MTASTNVGARDSGARRRILDATTRIMLEEGCTAATSRRVATQAGVKSALVHYYFPTMDDLYLAVFREGAAANMEHQQRALASDEPVRALWEWASDLHGSRLLLEFMALANRSETIRAEIAAWSERFREVQIAALNFILREHRPDTAEFPPAAVAVLIVCVGRMLMLENLLGITTGHDETRAVVDRLISRFEMPAAPHTRSSRHRHAKPAQPRQNPGH